MGLKLYLTTIFGLLGWIIYGLVHDAFIIGHLV